MIFTSTRPTHNFHPRHMAALEFGRIAGQIAWPDAALARRWQCSTAFVTMLQHDLRPVPAWIAADMRALRDALAGVPVPVNPRRLLA